MTQSDTFLYNYTMCACRPVRISAPGNFGINFPKKIFLYILTSKEMYAILTVLIQMIQLEVMG